jgi:hypothetical protein
MLSGDRAIRADDQEWRPTEMVGQLGPVLQ